MNIPTVLQIATRRKRPRRRECTVGVHDRRQERLQQSCNLKDEGYNMQVIREAHAALTSDQKALVQHHLGMVKRLAYYLLAHLPKTVPLEDLTQAGMLGLLDAARHFDPAKGAQFETYANIRIRGCIIDEVRKNDWVPRSVYRHARMIAEAVKTVENRVGRKAKDSEIAQELQVPLKDYYVLQKEALGGQLCSVEDLGLTEEMMAKELGFEVRNEPDENVEHDDLVHHMAKQIEALPHNEKLVLALYYEHDLNLKEIGEVLGVSESRVSQIHTLAMKHLKHSLT